MRESGRRSAVGPIAGNRILTGRSHDNIVGQSRGLGEARCVNPRSVRVCSVVGDGVIRDEDGSRRRRKRQIYAATLSRKSSVIHDDILGDRKRSKYVVSSNSASVVVNNIAPQCCPN